VLFVQGDLHHFSVLVESVIEYVHCLLLSVVAVNVLDIALYNWGWDAFFLLGTRPVGIIELYLCWLQFLLSFPYKDTVAVSEYYIEDYLAAW